MLGGGDDDAHHRTEGVENGRRPGRRMPRALKETSEGGLALTPAAKKLTPAAGLIPTDAPISRPGGR